MDRIFEWLPGSLTTWIIAALAVAALFIVWRSLWTIGPTEVGLVGNSPVIATLTPKGRNQARLSGRSPKPLPMKIPGRTVFGLLAPTPFAPEPPIPQVKEAEISISWSSFLYMRCLIVTPV